MVLRLPAEWNPAGLDCAPKEDVASAQAFLNSDDYRELCDWLGVRPSLAKRVRRQLNGKIAQKNGV